MVKPLHAEDPYELKGVVLDGGEPLIQAQIMIEEMLTIGTAPDLLHSMFNDKHYVGLFLLTEQLGTDVVRELISGTAEKMGFGKRTKTTVTDQE